MKNLPRTALAAVLFLLAGGIFAQRGAEILRVFLDAQPPGDYAVTVAQGGLARSLPVLPALDAFTAERIGALRPSLKESSIVLAGLEDVGAAGRLILDEEGAKRLRLFQKAVDPRVIVVESGDYDLPALYRAVGREDLLGAAGGVHTLRAPVLVRKGASLAINEGADLRLSRDGGAMILAEGDVFIFRAKVTGWDEGVGGPSLFRAAGDFRPFITAWSGGRLYVAGADIAHLGYESRKAYGLTYTTCQPCLAEDPRLGAPTGAVVESAFSGMYFGFYSYEAEDVAIVGNVYKDNIVYGIDPHDRSKRLIISGNDVSGTRLKHGIILSRGVSDGWIFNNRSHGNKGAGLMLDYMCENNVIAGNVLSRNGGDGLFFAESSSARAHGNVMTGNAGAGVRVRNSRDILVSGGEIADNGAEAVAVYAAALEDAGLKRDAGDVYEKRAALALAGVAVRGPEAAPAFRFDAVEEIVLSDIRAVSGAPLWKGITRAEAAAVADAQATVTLRPLAGGGP